MTISTDKQKIEELLSRGVDEVIEKDNLRAKLSTGKQLRVKLGIDPTGAQLHIGHAVPLRKLRAFQDMGHQAILLIGDYTATIGDPTGRDQTRPVLKLDDVKKNEITYIDQASKVLDMGKLEIRHNSEWYGNVNSTHLFMDLTSKITVARILERDDFQKRLKEGSDIQMQEIMYPLLQGYDSVALKADVELGGTDQKFNLLMGRKIQKRYDQPEQDIMTVPLLEGTDGERKMSKTYGNYIALQDEPNNMFGKVMSIPDNLMIKYFLLATDISADEIRKIDLQLKGEVNPRDIKIKLASSLVELYYDKDVAHKALEYFISTFSEKQKPMNIPELKPTAYDIATVLVEGKLVPSKSEARRAIEQGGVKLNDEKVEVYTQEVKAGDIVQKGKRFYVKVM